ncbi:hypothetical protein [Pseudoalteromonas sp. 5-MNA-CIBAN-0065]|uniref:hypothetical protein n=1 Tax=Pseudoalteromonas sp. 5-MNA-CIBAN-0065 TaxID=3140421 RepID=UPI0033259060
MTKSEIFKAAHKLAKAYQLENGGDYIVYLSMSLKNIIKSLTSNAADEVLFAAMNRRIAKVSSSLALNTRAVKKSYTHGLQEFKATYELEKAKRNLSNGKFFGKAFTKGGLVCAWVRSVEMVQEAY